METIKVQKNQIIAKQKEKVKAWYLILEGSVVQRNSYAREMKDQIIKLLDDWKGQQKEHEKPEKKTEQEK